MCLQADTLDKQFEKPLRQHLESYRSIVTVRQKYSLVILVSNPCLQERSNTYEIALREKSRIIRQVERENMQKKGRSE